MDYFQAEAGSSKVLLIVTEDLDIADLLVGPLQKKGYICEKAHDLHQAEELMASLEPDMILVDFFMSSINGVDFLKTVRALPGGSGTPVLFLSKVPDEFNEPIQAYENVDCVQEAYDADALMQKVEEVLA